MRLSLALAVVCICTVSYGQYPMYGQPPGWNPYMTKAEAMEQQRWQNQQWSRQQQVWEGSTVQRNRALDVAEQAARVRALKAQERYWRAMEEQAQPGTYNPFSYNPFYR